MDLNQGLRKNVKLSPINGVTKSKDCNRLRGGCTGLMYACQQGLADKIVKEVRSQVTLVSVQLYICAVRIRIAKIFSHT